MPCRGHPATLSSVVGFPHSYLCVAASREPTPPPGAEPCTRTAAACSRREDPSHGLAAGSRRHRSGRGRARPLPPPTSPEIHDSSSPTPSLIYRASDSTSAEIDCRPRLRMMEEKGPTYSEAAARKGAHRRMEQGRTGEGVGVLASSTDRSWRHAWPPRPRGGRERRAGGVAG
jgi:hypothetical protein